ncbi:hypothetical protein CBF34_06385 [Vagococcus penaei]|uniref:Uncharacterized protein n=1 Tax=Vagococcus penaei TaxID=633807 RepID=A0A1Q2D770_9ENTE|nr:CYTH domain-containing protein [Vagococcus penaei]AQP54161.1 hypothetical protein BW732_07965 [Vagococcus penaei]RSU02160.1 hypothetical protein CBF34_06385 [Vagococcus penaei]
MGKENEIEFKNLLSKSDYERLIEQYNVPQALSIKQTNYYFDTKDARLQHSKMGLRIRQTPTKNELTLKIPTQTEHTLTELTDNLSDEEVEQFLSHKLTKDVSTVLTYLANMGIAPTDLLSIGNLMTDRLEIKLDNHHLLVLDHSFYSDIEDYELEMEVTDEITGEQFFLNFLDRHQLPRREAPKKIARMLQTSQKY